MILWFVCDGCEIVEMSALQQIPSQTNMNFSGFDSHRLKIKC